MVVGVETKQSFIDDNGRNEGQNQMAESQPQQGRQQQRNQQQRF
ncbi:hypothetical protein [Natronoglomus mannanivorans]|uniref:Uncharacterized protein n=1 Tax=Natronoglomus mannanivorans TaxID=2979990 RepID=A0AAP2YYN0_9EURY|nr:hypothetical protein [Halobacteria archaeon AArc-xg1-1]